MRSFFIKVFMLLAAMLCMFEGLVLVAVGLRQLSSERLLSLYSTLMAAPKALTSVFGVGVFFVVLGFILLILSARSKPAPHEIRVEKDGKVLNIPEKAIKDFILQIIQQNPCVSDVTVAFERKEKEAIEIEVSASLDGVSSIYKELNELEEVLKSELDRVFEWKTFTIVFHLRGVGVDPKKKYFASSVIAAEAAPVTAETQVASAPEAVTAEAVEEEGDEEEKPVAGPVLTRKTAKEQTPGSSFLSKMLLGR